MSLYLLLPGTDKSTRSLACMLHSPAVINTGVIRPHSHQCPIQTLAPYHWSHALLTDFSTTRIHPTLGGESMGYCYRHTEWAHIFFHNDRLPFRYHSCFEENRMEAYGSVGCFRHKRIFYFLYVSVCVLSSAIKYTMYLFIFWEILPPFSLQFRSGLIVATAQWAWEAKVESCVLRNPPNRTS